MEKLKQIAKYSALLLISVFLVATATAILNYPKYDPMKNYLSDLGVGRNSANFFNYGLMLTGLFGIIFSYALLRILKETETKIGAGILLISTVSLIFVGVFTENAKTLHYIFSAGFFILSASGIALIGFSLKDLSSKVYVFVVIFFGALMLPILEHLAVLLFGVWCIECVIKLHKNK